MDKNEDRYRALHKKIKRENKEFSETSFHAQELEGEVVKNLQLLKSLIQSERVKSDLFEEKASEKPSFKSQSIESLEKKVIETLTGYSEKKLAKFTIPKKFQEECFELLVSAWRQKINKEYSQTLTFIDVRFSKESYRAFVIALSLNVSLKALRLEECGLKEYEMKLLAVLIKIHPTLTFLHLDKNPILDAGLSSILAALKQNETLLYLSLIQTSLTDKGAKEITILLSKRPLKVIHLEKNHFSEKALTPLIEMAAKTQCEISYDEAED